MNFRQIISDAGISSARKVISILSGIVTIPVITRLAGEGTYGIWVTLIAFIGLAASVGELHLHGSLVRYSQNRPEEQALADVVTLSVVAAGLTALVTGFGASIYNQVVAIEFISQKLIVPIALLVGLRLLETILMNYPRAKGRVKLYELLVTLRIALKTSGIILAFWQFGTVAAALWGCIIATVGINSILAVTFRNDLFTLPNPASFSQYLRYGLPMVPKEIAGSLINHSDKFLLLFFLGPVPAGVYSAAKSVSSIFPKLSGVFDSTLYPNVSAAWEANEHDELRSFYNRFLRWYSILVIPAVVGITLLAAPTLQLISTETVVEQGTVLIPVLAVGFALQGLEFSFSYPLTAAEKTKMLGGITIVAVVANLILNVVLIPTVGIVGAAIATVVAFAARSGLLVYYTDDLLNISLPMSGMRDSAISTLVMGVVLLALPVNTWMWELLAYPIIGAISFAVAFVLVDGLKKDEIEFIYDRFPVASTL